jgi:pSer/pThr/pTyr-binding forkhead associated (FHA) protein
MVDIEQGRFVFIYMRLPPISPCTDASIPVGKWTVVVFRIDKNPTCRTQDSGQPPQAASWPLSDSRRATSPNRLLPAGTFNRPGLGFDDAMPTGVGHRAGTFTKRGRTQAPTRVFPLAHILLGHLPKKSLEVGQVGEIAICTLVVFSKDGRVSHLQLDGKSVVIGRSAECDLRLQHRSVSRRHARLFLTDGDWFLSDLRSTNGTLVNGKRIANRWLKSGDLIRIGAYGLRFENQSVRPAPKAADSANEQKRIVGEGVNDHGVSATPETVSRCRHDRFPHPGPLPVGEGDRVCATRDFHRKYTPAPAEQMQVDLRDYYQEFPNARLESDYPRIWNEIIRQWSTTDCDRYLHQLIHTERIGRQGFPLHIMSELLCLLHVHPRHAGSPVL